MATSMQTSPLTCESLDWLNVKFWSSYAFRRRLVVVNDCTFLWELCSFPSNCCVDWMARCYEVDRGLVNDTLVVNDRILRNMAFRFSTPVAPAFICRAAKHKPISGHFPCWGDLELITGTYSQLLQQWQRNKINNRGTLVGSWLR